MQSWQVELVSILKAIRGGTNNASVAWQIDHHIVYVSTFSWHVSSLRHKLEEHGFEFKGESGYFVVTGRKKPNIAIVVHGSTVEFVVDGRQHTLEISQDSVRIRIDEGDQTWSVGLTYEQLRAFVKQHDEKLQVSRRLSDMRSIDVGNGATVYRTPVKLVPEGRNKTDTKGSDEGGKTHESQTVS